MSARNDKILRHVRLAGQGVEIGPSYSPIVSKKDGHRVDIIDHLSREDLIRKYQDHQQALENIEEVDFVWHGESYAELTGKGKYYDWIIASHLVEHTPDLIGFLNNCDSILKDDGVLSLVVPDKRFCFDHFRPITGLARIIDSHFLGNQIHTPGAAAEYFLNVVKKDGAIAWDAQGGGAYSFIHTLADAARGIELVRADQAYLDVHAWCFVPHSFRLIIQDLFNLGLIPLQEVDFFPTAGYEFYITLGRQGKGAGLARLELLERIEAEVKAAEPAVQPAPASKPEGFLQRWLKRLR